MLITFFFTYRRNLVNTRTIGSPHPIYNAVHPRAIHLLSPPGTVTCGQVGLTCVVNQIFRGETTVLCYRNVLSIIAFVSVNF